MVHEAVDHGCGDDVVAEDFAPAIWGWHLFAVVETRCWLGLSVVFAFCPSSKCDRSMLGAALIVQV